MRIWRKIEGEVEVEEMRRKKKVVVAIQNYSNINNLRREAWDGPEI